MSRNIYRTQSAGVENSGIIMHHSKTQYISLKALTNELKFIDLRSILPHLTDKKPKHNTVSNERISAGTT